MRLSEIVWGVDGVTPYDAANVIHRTTAELFTLYVNEVGTYELVGHDTNHHDRADLTRLELAAVLADFIPAPTEDTTT
jgi:hypothetical protein